MVRNQKTNPITILLADDHPLLRAGFATMLKKNPELDVIAETDNPHDAVEKYKSMHPHVVVMDILFTEKTTGLDAIKLILEHDEDAKVVVLTQHDQDRMIKEAYKFGAKAFITKNSSPTLLINAIKKAARGELFFLPEIAERLAIMTTRGEPSPIDVLSDREYEVFKLIALGKKTSEIAHDLGLSVKTISNVLYSVKNKLGFSRTADLTRLALRHGVIDLE